MLGSVSGLRNASILVFFVCLGLVVVSCGSIVYRYRACTHIQATGQIAFPFPLRNASLSVCLGVFVVSCGSIFYRHLTHTHAGDVADRVPVLGQALGLC
jgi:hypothetical protein